MAVTGILLTCLAALLIYLAVRLYSKYPSSKVRALVEKIPGPPARPIVGHAHIFKRGAEFYEQLHTLCKEYGHKGIIRAWLGYHCLVVATNANAAEVLLKSSTHMTKSFLYDFIRPWLGTGLLMLISTGSKWHARRKMITPTFHFKILEDFLEVFNEQSTVMTKHLEKMAGKSKGFDVIPFVTLCALDIICDTAMGRHVNAQAHSDSEYVQAIYRISDLIMERIRRPWLWPDGIYRLLPAGKEHERLLTVLHSFTNEVIRERTAEWERHLASDSDKDSATTDKPSLIGGRKRLAFLDMLLHASAKHQLTVEDIREEVDTFMFEGHDTTSAAISWAIHLIGANPEVQKKVHDELDQIFGQSDRLVTMDDIKQMKYLECVVKESLRLFPSVPMMAREIAEDCTINGFFVPKGSTGVIQTSVIHRDPDYFPEPEAFKPERFTNENSVGRHPFCYIPFSAGLRNCIGQKFAMIEEKVLLSSILRHFQIASLQKRGDLMPSGEIILRSQNGINIKLEKR
uniref:Cytochrome P450 n=1 Tax=Thalassodrilides sp. MI-2015 TaxID=1742877 RepID=A0A1B4XVI9_9ANNE|nr:cytochrome P450 [Thalassodrilides sp. MI-2015]